MLKEPGGRELVLQAIADAQPWTPPTAQQAADEQEGVVSKITNAVEVAVATESTDSGTKTILQPLPMSVVLGLIRASTDSWPRRVDQALFVPDAAGKVSWLIEAPAAFGWLANQTGVIKWHKSNGCASKSEVYAELVRTVQAYIAVEELPHWPPLANHFYACPEVQPGDGVRSGNCWTVFARRPKSTAT